MMAFNRAQKLAWSVRWIEWPWQCSRRVSDEARKQNSTPDLAGKLHQLGVRNESHHFFNPLRRKVGRLIIWVVGD
jgi:hypothetical protein